MGVLNCGSKSANRPPPQAIEYKKQFLLKRQAKANYNFGCPPQ
jgi:hypothetical protein